jgi:hypothetical protein
MKFEKSARTFPILNFRFLHICPIFGNQRWNHRNAVIRDALFWQSPQTSEKEADGVRVERLQKRGTQTDQSQGDLLSEIRAPFVRKDADNVDQRCRKQRQWTHSIHCKATKQVHENVEHVSVAIRRRFVKLSNQWNVIVEVVEVTHQEIQRKNPNKCLTGKRRSPDNAIQGANQRPKSSQHRVDSKNETVGSIGIENVVN